MQKVIPKNPRYADIIATVDSGASLSRYLRKLDEANESESFIFSFIQDFKIKPGEIFRRMKMTTFVQLVIQVAEINGPSGHQDAQIKEDDQAVGNNILFIYS